MITTEQMDQILRLATAYGEAMYRRAEFLGGPEWKSLGDYLAALRVAPAGTRPVRVVGPTDSFDELRELADDLEAARSTCYSLSSDFEAAACARAVAYFREQADALERGTEPPPAGWREVMRELTFGDEPHELISCDECGGDPEECPGTCAIRRGRALLATSPGGFDLVAHLHRQREFSERTFGPGMRTAGVSDHIRKELAEIAQAPGDLEEWVDVILLALDGAWRTGAAPEAIAEAIAAKQAKNERRTWPDWRTVPAGKAIEHDRRSEA